MPISTMGFDAGALAALASKNAPYLNLPVAYLDLGAPMQGLAQGIFKKADYDQQNNQLQQQLMAQQQMEQQRMGNQMNLAQFGAQNDWQKTLFNAQQQAMESQANRQNQYDIGINRDSATLQKAQLEQAMKEKEFGLNAFNARSLDTYRNQSLAQQGVQNQAALQQQKQELELKKRSLMDKDQLNIRGAGASMLYMMTQDPSLQQNPGALNEALNDRAGFLHSKGAMDENELKAFQAMPLQQKQQSLVYDLALTDKAGLLKDHPMFNQVVSKEQKEKIQEQITNDQTDLQMLNDLKGKFNSDFFKYWSTAQDTIGDTLGKSPDWVKTGYNMIAKTVGAPSADQFKEFSKGYDEFWTQVKELNLNRMQGMKGVRLNDSAMKILGDTNPTKHDSPDDAEAKMDRRIELLQRAIQIKQNVLSNGGSMTDVNKAINETITSSMLNPTSQPTESTTQSTSTQSRKFATNEQIDAITASNPGKTRQQIIEELKAQNVFVR